ncbi:ATP-binding protein [Actinomyces wuliandei]|uniref:ATP-binding protein n=1 Tax=Actinomyces wuliandei TaxID=2057743 RepID=UPI001117E647|nr:ATP-binding protein [Actinomyces wuliandei]
MTPRTPRVASLVTSTETPAQRRHRTTRENQLRRQLREQARAEQAQARAATRALSQGDYLPALGEKAPRTGRQLLEATVPTQRTSTRVLRVAYPFVADQGLGHQGILIGTDILHHTAFSYDPFHLYRHKTISNPNITVAGTIGSGKSALVKCLALRGAAFGYRTFIPGDIKDEWTPVVSAVGGTTITVGGTSHHRVNPLDPGRRPDRDENGDPVDDQAWTHMVRSQRLRLLTALTTTLMGHPPDQEDHTALAAALDRAARRATTPVLPTLAEELLTPTPGPATSLPLGVSTTTELADMGRRTGLYLQRLVTGDLAGTFDGPTTVAFDPAAPMLSLSIRGVSDGDQRLPLLMTCAQTWMEASLRGTDLGQRLMVYDEAHRLMPAPGLLSRMRDQWKLCRAWGISNVLVLHRLSDTDAAGAAGSTARALAEGLVADTSTRIVYHQEPDQLDRTTTRLGLGAIAQHTLTTLTQGQALWAVADRRYLVAHHRTPWETPLTDTDNAMLT